MIKNCLINKSHKLSLIFGKKSIKKYINFLTKFNNSNKINIKKMINLLNLQQKNNHNSNSNSSYNKF